MLRIEHLSKAYGEKKAVDDLNLHIAPGEIYGFIGHNGAGKTTTLKSVAGILQFDQGEIYVDGKSIRTQPLECKRTFAYIPDNPDLYDYMTGIKYLNFVADIFGVSAADRQDRIRQYAGLFELTEDLAQPIAAYSHGMKQKLAIISAWLHRPRLILMDEPFVGLDPKAAHLLKGMMRQVCDEGGAIFFSTHVLEVAEKLCGPLAAAGLDWLYFALTGGIAVLLGVFGSIFNTYAGLYLPKDNDLLLSMPVPVSSLVAARLSGVYLMGLMYSAVVILPAVVVYWATVGVTASAVLGGLVLTLLISLAVLVLSCALGWVAAKISQKLRNKSLVVVLASLVFIGLYYFVYFKAQSVLQDLLANAGTYGAQIRSRAYPLYLFGSVGTGSGAAMLAVTAAVAALCGLMWVLLSRSFLHIATSTGKTARRTYRETALRRRSVDGALLHRELAHFAANPAYMLNCGLGTFLMPICAAAVLWKGGSLFAMLDALFADTEGSVPVMLCVLLCGLASMNLMTAPSVSLEGKSLWLMQSLPVEPWQALRAKLRMQVLLTVPPLLLCAMCAAIVYPLGLVRLLVMAVFAASYALLGALAGLTLGVKMPVLTWTDQLMPIKQSAPVMLTLFGGMGYTVLLFAGFLLLPGWRLGFAGYAACFAAANLLLCAVLHRWLRKKGAALFAAL